MEGNKMCWEQEIIALELWIGRLNATEERIQQYPGDYTNLKGKSIFNQELQGKNIR